jgi:hypothetical protein
VVISQGQATCIVSRDRTKRMSEIKDHRGYRRLQENVKEGSGRKRDQAGLAVQTVRPELGCLRGGPIGTSGGELPYR